MSYNLLTENERYQIDAFIKAGFTQKEIADRLKRSPSTISRELKRNCGLRGYRPAQAQRLSYSRRIKAYKTIKLTDIDYGSNTSKTKPSTGCGLPIT